MFVASHQLAITCYIITYVKSTQKKGPEENMTKGYEHSLTGNGICFSIIFYILPISCKPVFLSQLKRPYSAQGLGSHLEGPQHRILVSVCLHPAACWGHNEGQDLVPAPALEGH